MHRLALLALLLGACGDSGDHPSSCSDPTTSATVTLHTTWRTQLLDPPQPGDATWVAVRDGEDGCPWQPMTGDGSGTYALPVTHDAYAVAVACADPSVAPSYRIIERTVGETVDLHAACGKQLADTSDAHQIGVTLEGNDDGPAWYRWFVRNSPSTPLEMGGAGVTTMAHFARTGHYDIAVLGHTGAEDDPDRLLFRRALDGTIEQLVDADASASDGWSTFGAPVASGSPPADARGTDITYVTDGGTFVPIATGLTAPLQVPTWPGTLGAPGDVYLADASGLSEDLTRDWDDVSFATDPTAFAFATVPQFGPTTSLDSDGWHFAPLAGAQLYELTCGASAFALQYDATAGAIAAQGTDGYQLASFPDDPSSPPWPALNGCTYWTGTAVSSTGGLATDDKLDLIGTTPGIPAQLAGTQRWQSRVRM
jgi:hypothetical protein